jgi:hypothetical protein
MDDTLGGLSGMVASAMSISTSLGLTLCKATTVLSLSLAAIYWFFDGMPLVTVVKHSLGRVVEFSLWMWVIANTWSGFGWFPTMISAAGALGSTIGGVPFSISSWKTDVLPANLLTLGAGLFSEIVGAAEFGKGGILSLLVQGLTGDVIFETAIFIFAVISGGWAFLVLAYAAFRLWMALGKVYILAPLSFLQGLAGSRRLSPMSGSFISGAIILSCEVLTTFVLTGLLYNAINLIQTKFHIVETTVVSTVPTWCSNPLLAPFCSTYSGSTIKLGSLIAVNIVMTMFAWFIRDVPRLVRDALEGRFTVSPQEVSAVLAASPSMTARAMGHGLNIASAGAQSGTGAAFNTAVKPAVDGAKQVAGAAAMVGVGALTGGTGAAAIGMAAGRGAMMGGGRGAMLAGAGRAMFGERLAAAKAAAAGGEEGTITSAVSDGASAGRGGSSSGAAPAGAHDIDESLVGSGGGSVGSSSGASDADQSRTVSVDTEYQTDNGTPPPIPDVDGAAQRTRTTTIDDLQQRGSQSSGSGSFSSSGSGWSGGGSRSGGGGGSSGGAGGIMGELSNEMNAHMTLGKMFAMRALYMTARPPTPPPPPPDERSASVPLSVAGNRS